MRLIRTYTDLDEQDRGASVAIGNFDGVHLGHQAVIGMARAVARERSCPLGVVTFEPHPREFFAPKAPPFRLMNSEAKVHRLERLGVGCLYELPFNIAMAALDARAFVEKVIVAGLGLRHVVIGSDFRFGRGRSGNAADLSALGAEFGFGVTEAELLVCGSGTMRVSSTRIREALSGGRPRDAMEMLGHWHRIEGPVIHGEKRGRQLGYPTANMSLAGLHPPKFGVYAVLIDVLDGPHKGAYRGVSSLGVRPMFGGEVANLESYLFDFEGDLYGADVSVALVDYLRPEQKFDSLEALIRQMSQDSESARAILAAL